MLDNWCALLWVYSGNTLLSPFFLTGAVKADYDVLLLYDDEDHETEAFATDVIGRGVQNLNYRIFSLGDVTPGNGTKRISRERLRESVPKGGSVALALFSQ